MHPDAHLVRFGADFGFYRRRHSAELVARVLKRGRALGWPVELLDMQVGCGGACAVARDRSDPDAEFWERKVRIAINPFMVVWASGGKGATAAAARQRGQHSRAA